MYKIIQYDSIQDYIDLALPFLYENEIANSRNIGMLDRWSVDGNWQLLVLIFCDDKIVGSVVQGNKSNSHLILSVMNEKPLCALIRYLCDSNYSFTTVTGEAKTVNLFVAYLKAKCKLDAVLVHDLETLILGKDNFKSTQDSSLVNVTPRDLDSVTKLCYQFYNDAFPHLAHHQLNDYAKNEAVRFCLRPSEGYLMLHNEVIVGFVAIVRKTRNLYGVGLLVVDKEYRGYGYGKLLIYSISDYVLKQDKHAILTVEKQNSIARNMYYAVGYKYFGDDATYQFI